MDVQLILALLAGIAVIIAVVLLTRLDAFVALILASLTTGLIAGQDPVGLVGSITNGFGSTMGSIGIVIGLGVMIGKFLEVSGAADALAHAFLRAFGSGREAWAMGAVGNLVSIPVFCDSGYVIMNPLARSIARVKRGGYVTLALALGCGMTLTHHLVPPTPGPLAATGILGADLGLVIVTGAIFTLLLLPVVVLYAKWIGPKLEDKILPEVREAVYGVLGHEPKRRDGRIVTYDPDEYFGGAPQGSQPHSVGAFRGSLPLIVPLILILANTVASAIDKAQQGNPALGQPGQPDYVASAWAKPFIFLGNPVVALLIGLVIAVYFIMPRWAPKKKFASWFSESASSAGLILLITGAGGSFGQVLRDSGVGDEVASAIAGTALPAFLVPFLIATLVRIAQGSGTVAIITAASVTAPIMGQTGLAPLVAVIACTAGSMVFSYFNDSYFWVVTRFTGLEGTDALRGWSGITTAAWAGSIPLLLILSLIV
ncbi:SLC13 family permease [Actinobaculum sp. 352]|uniref:GntP family permease n=1 Tax=Actinobaculum sp. 352 TaxID=2490946 RepID=UPI0019D205CB|nr:SLC13 family permease [Actinobaculum sp. 352]